MGSVEKGEAVAAVHDRRELVISHCRLVFETGFRGARRELLQAQINISRCIDLEDPEREIKRLLEELQRTLKALAMISRAVAIENPH
jgi:hypothetical protein